MKYEVIVMGASAGGMNALQHILTVLSEDFLIPIIIVQHISRHSDNYLVQYLNDLCNFTVKEADEKEIPVSGTIYIAPPNYHLLLEEDTSFSLSVEKQVNYSRPSIDILFESASDTYGEKLIGIVLTGANRDGSLGLKMIKNNGGLTIVQDPDNAEVDIMPKAAIKNTEIDYILSLEEIGQFLNKINKEL